MGSPLEAKSGSYNTDNCKDNNWFYNTWSQWIVTPVYNPGNSPGAAILSSDGMIYAMWSAAQAVDTKPVVYLKPTATIYDGKGTSDKPYLLEIVS